jgi:hypothetical protein
MARYPPWTPRRAARFGYLAGRGLSADAIGSDPAVAAVSRQAVHHVATRWGIPLAPGATGTIVLPVDVVRELDGPARERRTTVEALALAVLRVVARDRLVDAVIDDREDDEH